MTLKIHNSFSHTLEVFEPIAPPKVSLYTCGPTVYNYAHIGNYRAYIFEDLLRRYLAYSGYDVTQVMNLTDVDDKTIRGAIEAGLSLNDFTKPFKEAFFKDLDLLNIERAEHYPAATDHIDGMIKLIETLIEKGHGYVSDDGSVYFRISSFDQYGKMARLDMNGMQAGARVDQDEYDKESLADFALWKAWSEGDGPVGWESPWGRGRPGWHIECSAMSMQYLGNSFDLHTGGVDNLFPHHEDEIAQSECASGEKFVKYWMHCEHLLVENSKMSKSKGNFFTLDDLFAYGITGRELRYVLLAAHYRAKLNFKYDHDAKRFESLESARVSLQRIDEFIDRLKGLPDNASEESPSELEWIAEADQRFRLALDQDLNMPEALSVLFSLVTLGNREMDEGGMTASDAQALLAVLRGFDTVFGYLFWASDGPPADVVALAEERDRARSGKDYAESDRLRDAIAEFGWQVKDTANGGKLTKLLK